MKKLNHAHRYYDHKCTICHKFAPPSVAKHNREAHSKDLKYAETTSKYLEEYEIRVEERKSWE